MQLRFDPERPIYQQIIDEFKRAVARGELVPGDRIPSQRDLATEARVNPNTVQRAYREMEWMGLVETLRGQGTFVAQAPELLASLREDMARAAVDRFVQDMAALGFASDAILNMAAASLHAAGKDRDDSSSTAPAAPGTTVLTAAGATAPTAPGAIGGTDPEAIGRAVDPMAIDRIAGGVTDGEDGGRGGE